jgi:hypothetical protein
VERLASKHNDKGILALGEAIRHNVNNPDLELPKLGSLKTFGQIDISETESESLSIAEKQAILTKIDKTRVLLSKFVTFGGDMNSFGSKVEKIGGSDMFHGGLYSL